MRHTVPVPGTQAVARAFAVLRAFTDAHRLWSLADLAPALRLAKPTTLRLLSVLEREGMVTRSAGQGTWQLGPAAIELGARAERATSLCAAARPELERLAWTTGETASLEILIGNEILVLDEVRGRFRGSAVECAGTRWPAHAAATGKVLLAAARAEGGESWRQFKTLTRGRLPSFTPRTLNTSALLVRELDRTLRRGYATAVEELEVGYLAIGAPIVGHAGRVIAAMCVGGPAARLGGARLKALVADTRDAATRVGERLGKAPTDHARRTGPRRSTA